MKIKQLGKIFMRSGENSALVYHCRGWTGNSFIRRLLKILVTPYCMLKYFHVKDFPGRDGLAMALIAKNEAPYIEEWINFHVKQGVSHFFIYDNESTDNLRGVLEKYISSGLVTYHLLKGMMRQSDAYNIAMYEGRKIFKYMAVLDCDEFLFVRKNTLGGGGYDLFEFVDNFMKAHPNAGGIAVNWLIFGSNGHKTKPEGGVLENYTMCAEKNFSANHGSKTICDPAKVFYWNYPHSPVYRKGFENLNEDGEISGSNGAIHFEKIRINHYFTKSKEEYIAKKNRGMADQKGLRPMSDFDVHDQNIIHNTEILERV